MIHPLLNGCIFMGSAELTTEQVARAVESLAAAIGADIKFLKDTKANNTNQAGSGINLLSDYLKNFSGVGVDWTPVDLTATVDSSLALKHIRGSVLKLETTNTNIDAAVYLDTNDSTYDNVQLVSGQKYIYSYYAKCNVTGKQLKAIVRLSDGTYLDSTHTLTDTNQRHSMSFTMPAGETGVVLAFYPNQDGEAGNIFYIQGLMLERVINLAADNTNPSEYSN